jgi:hypothetical protein
MNYLIYTDFENLSRLYAVPDEWLAEVEAIDGKVCGADNLSEEQINTFTCISEKIHYKEWLPVTSSECVSAERIFIAGWVP